MMAGNGFIKLHRKLTEWGWYSDSATKDVFLHLLLTANFKESEFKGEKIMPGQTIIGLDALSKQLGLSVKRVRTALKHLENTGEITKKSTNRFTVVTIKKWDDYQLIDCDEGNQEAIKGQAEGNQAAIKGQHMKNDKKKKNEKKDKNNIIYTSYGEFENVNLSEEELEKLKERFPYDWQDRIEKLSVYMQSKGKRYKSHYATILNWARKEKRDESGGAKSADTGGDYDYRKFFD